MTKADVASQIKDLPVTAGVYIFKNSKDVAIYIGKAKNLKSRVASYFDNSNRDSRPQLANIKTNVAKVSYIQTQTEIDALILESRLVRDIQPRYNVQLKDDKSFTLLGITKTDDFPKVFVTRESDMDESKADYIGPFTNADDLRISIKTLQKIFKFATCNIPMSESNEKRRFFRPCLLHYIDHCTAPCAAKISKNDYNESISSFKKFLQGRKKSLMKSLVGKMNSASLSLDYERAKEYRDQIKALENLSEHLNIEEGTTEFLTPIDPKEALENLAKILGLKSKPRIIDGVDISTIGGQETVGSIIKFVDGVPFKKGYRRFKIKTADENDDYSSIREVTGRYFSRLKREKDVSPDIFLIDGGLGHLNTVAKGLKSIGCKLPILLSLAKKEENVFRYGDSKPLKIRKDSLGLRLLMYVRDEAHRFAKHYQSIVHRKVLFD